MAGCRVAIHGVLIGLLLLLPAGGCVTDSESGGAATASADQRFRFERRPGPAHRPVPRRMRVARPGPALAEPVPEQGDEAADAGADAGDAADHAEADGMPGLEIETLETGGGAKAKATSQVIVKLLGKLEDGTVFQRIDEPAGPWPVDRLIPGLTRTITGMAEGGRRRVTIPPNLAYGDRAVADRETGETLIPGGATVVYEVELVSVASRVGTEDRSGKGDNQAATPEGDTTEVAGDASQDLPATPAPATESP